MSEFWSNGICIEGEALLTAKRCRLVRRGVPVSADEIRALMTVESGHQGASLISASFTPFKIRHENYYQNVLQDPAHHPRPGDAS
ncbi:MAG TPA: hypothetical protein PLR78_10555, partial [Polaromonas sp.]|nr:hypothetical protein [Polaromonas sp.]